MKAGHTWIPDDEVQLALKSAGVRNDWPGYFGAFTRNQAEGAIPNGRKIKKIKLGSGDTHPIGSTGVVLGSIFRPGMGYLYFIEWDSDKGFAVASNGFKIGPA